MSPADRGSEEKQATRRELAVASSRKRVRLIKIKSRDRAVLSDSPRITEQEKY